MSRIAGLILSLTVLVPLWAQDSNVEEQKIAKAAKNPYSLGRYLDSHSDIDGDLLWKVLDGEPGPPMDCDSTHSVSHCSVEVITAFNPEQVIVIVKGGAGADVYLRYRPEKGGAWRLAGTYGALAKYMSSEHRLDWTSGVPHLVITELAPPLPQPGEPTISSEFYDVWFDLSQPEFKFKLEAPKTSAAKVPTPVRAADPNVEGQQIAKAAKNPYSLGRYIESHPAIDWKLVWKVFDSNMGPAMGCDSNYPLLRCSVEVITAFNPDQVILMIRGPLDADAYLRFWPQKGGAWRLAGSHLSPVKDLKSHHQMDSTSGIPYLRTVETGLQEPGRSSTDVLWFDLRKETFDPVFRFASHASNEASQEVKDCKAFGRNMWVEQNPGRIRLK